MTDHPGCLLSSRVTTFAAIEDRARYAANMWSGERDPWLGVEVANFMVRSLMRRGGMGAIYLLEHRIDPTIRRVLKVVSPENGKDPTLQARFELEARAMSMLRHDNIIRIENLGYLDDLGGYMVMPYLPGETLTEYLASVGPLDAHRAGMVMLQVLLALDTAHAAGVIHRDLKPENIFLERRTLSDHHVVLLDFGIACVPARVPRQLTIVGTTVGTPGYMSSERLCGFDATVATDIFSAAVVLFEMLAGVKPWAGCVTLREHLDAQNSQRPQRPSHVSEALFATISRGLALDSAGRWPSAKAFAIALANAIPAVPEKGLPAGWELLSRYARPFLRDRETVASARMCTITVEGTVPPGVQWQAPGARTVSLPNVQARPVPGERRQRRRGVAALAVSAVLGAGATFAAVHGFAEPVAAAPPAPSPSSESRAAPATPISSTAPATTRIADVKPLLECPKPPAPAKCPVVRVPRPQPRVREAMHEVPVIHLESKQAPFDPDTATGYPSGDRKPTFDPNAPMEE